MGSTMTWKNHRLFELSRSNTPNNNPIQSFDLAKIYLPNPVVLVYNLIKPDFAFIKLLLL